MTKPKYQTQTKTVCRGNICEATPLMLSLFLNIATRGLHVALGLGWLRITCHTLNGPQRNLPKEQGCSTACSNPI